MMNENYTTEFIRRMMIDRVNSTHVVCLYGPGNGGGEGRVEKEKEMVFETRLWGLCAFFLLLKLYSGYIYLRWHLRAS